MDNFVDDLMDAIAESEFDIDCPTCGKEFTVTVSDVGNSVACPNCGEIIKLESK